MYIYLASPYSHPDKVVREQRFRTVCRCAARILQRGQRVYAPVAYTHPIALYGGLDPLKWEMYRATDIELLRRAHRLWIIALDGWRDSIGVNTEANVAEAVNIPITLINEHAELIGAPQNCSWVQFVNRFGNTLEGGQGTANEAT